MDKKRLESILSVFSIVLVLFYTGCTGMLADSIAESYPTYQETTAEWPTIKEGYGRAIIYFPKKGVKNFPFGDIVEVFLTIDEGKKSSMIDRSFIFADLSEGMHKITFQGRGVFSQSTDFDINVKSGNFYYVELDATTMKINPPRIVDEAEALSELELLHHLYEKALPVQDQ